MPANKTHVFSKFMLLGQVTFLTMPGGLMQPVGCQLGTLAQRLQGMELLFAWSLTRKNYTQRRITLPSSEADHWAIPRALSFISFLTTIFTAGCLWDEWDAGSVYGKEWDLGSQGLTFDSMLVTSVNLPLPRKNYLGRKSPFSNYFYQFDMWGDCVDWWLVWKDPFSYVLHHSWPQIPIPYEREKASWILSGSSEDVFASLMWLCDVTCFCEFLPWCLFIGGLSWNCKQIISSSLYLLLAKGYSNRNATVLKDLDHFFWTFWVFLTGVLFWGRRRTSWSTVKLRIVHTGLEMELSGQSPWLTHIKPWGLSPGLCKLGIVVHACKLSTGEVMAGGSEICYPLKLYAEFKVSLEYTRLC